MSTPRLDEALKAHYERKTLDGETVKAWAPPSRRRLWLGGAALAAAAAALLFVSGRGPSIEERLAAEVWAHHEMRKTPEVSGESFAALGEGLDRLGFSLVASARLSGLRPVGARYCSLSGQLAAQVTLEDPEGRPYTLYVTENSARFSEVDPHSKVVVDGGEVEIWTERGLIYGVAPAP